MIKRDSLLIALGAFAPLSPRTDQADVALQGIPQLRQLIEAKFSKPTPHRCHSTIALTRIHVIVRLICARAHRPKFQKNEPFPSAADSFLAEQGRNTVLCPYEQSRKEEQWRTNDKRHG